MYLCPFVCNSMYVMAHLFEIFAVSVHIKSQGQIKEEKEQQQQQI